jgi:GNAT superfamily N-acetyltransferase
VSDRPVPALAFRPALASDVGAIVALVQSAYRGESSRRGWTTEADLLDGTRTDADEVGALIAGPDSMILLGEQGGELLASASLERRRETAYFGMFAVRPDRQRSGIGGALMVEAESVARNQWGCTAMEMSVISVRAELIAWYLRRGYQRTERYRAFPYGIARYGAPRRADLRLEVLRKNLA